MRPCKPPHSRFSFVALFRSRLSMLSPTLSSMQLVCLCSTFSSKASWITTQLNHITTQLNHSGLCAQHKESLLLSRGTTFDMTFPTSPQKVAAASSAHITKEYFAKPENRDEKANLPWQVFGPWERASQYYAECCSVLCFFE